MKGYLVIDDVSLKEARDILKKLDKKGRWYTVGAMKKLDTAAIFAITTHGFPRVQDNEVYEFR